MLVKLDECNHNPPSTDYTLHIANLALAYQRLREADVTSGKK